MSDRVSLVELERKKSGSKVIYFLFFGLFFIITLIVIYRLFSTFKPVSNSLVPQAAPTPTPTIFSGLFSPDNKYRALRIDNQLQIFSGNSDTLLFKIYDRSELVDKNSTSSATKTGQYLPDKWSDDSRSLVYKLTYPDSSNFGLIYLNSSNIFVADPTALAPTNCSFYGWSPDGKKIVFYKSSDKNSCLGPLMTINNKITVRNLGSKSQSIENAFWDSDSKKLNLNILNIGSSITQTKIISL